MILLGVLFGAAVTVGVGIVAAFWDDLVGFLKRAVDKVKEVVSGVVYGVKIRLQKLAGIIRAFGIYYSYNDGVWEETTVSKPCREEDVPPEFRERLLNNGGSVDVTNDLQLTLQNARG